ncbi:MAG: TonB-dependent receptor [Porphyromonas sp.]|nr:TonB-dependent receptor [Porphyromonas sp.]
MKVLLCAACLSLMPAYTLQAQCEYTSRPEPNSERSLRGRIVGADGAALASATITLLDKDGNILDGAVSDQKGYFVIGKRLDEAQRIRVEQSGYEVYEEPLASGAIELGEIKLHLATTQLQTVEVKVHRKAFRLQGTELRANVAATSLSQLPTMLHVLAAMPFVKADGQGVEVQGRGTPIIYYGHRQVTFEELLQLNPQDVKDVDLQLIPDASFPAGTAAVIRIKPKSVTARSMGAYLRGDLTKQQAWGHYGLGQVYWDSPKLSVKLGGLHTEKNSQELKSLRVETTDARPRSSMATEADERNGSTTAVGWLDAVYRPSEAHEIGAKYQYQSTYKLRPWVQMAAELSLAPGQRAEYNSTIDMMLNRPLASHTLNAYYHGVLTEQWRLHGELNYYATQGRYTQRTLLHYVQPSERKDENRAESAKTADNTSWRTYVERSLPKGRLQIGFDGSLSNITQDYQQLVLHHQQLLPSTTTQSATQRYGLFASWTHRWTEQLGVQLGLRAEYYQTATHQNTKLVDEQRSLYLYPSLSISYNKGAVSTSLSYETNVLAPSYNNLQASIMYIDELLLQSGNPLLRPMQTNKLTLVSSYKDWTLTAAYAHERDADYLGNSRYELDPNRLLIRPENYTHSLYKLGLSYSPTIGVWRPQWEAWLKGQRFTHLGERMTKPFVIFSWNNVLALRGGWTLQASILKQFGGHDAIHKYGDYYQIDFSINKSLGKHWSISLSAEDLTTSGQKEYWGRTAISHSYYLSNSDYADWRLSISYNINAKQDRYRGGAAGSAERSRF